MTYSAIRSAKRLKHPASKHLLFSAVLLGALATSNAAMPHLALQKQASKETRASDHVIVRFRPQVQDHQRAGILAQAGLAEQSPIRQLGLHRISVPTGKTPEQVVQDLKRSFGSQIEYAQVDPLVYPSRTLSDTFIGSQYNISITELPSAWDSVDGTGTTIAICDTGVDSTHPDLAASLVPGYNVAEDNTDTSDQYGHGTFVAGVAAAIGDNSAGIAGAAYRASIMPVKIVIGGAGSTPESVMAAGVVYAVDHGAKIINVSFGGSTCNTSVFLNAGDYARQRGALVVQAAGNDTTDRGCTTTPEVLLVSSTDSSDQMSVFSNFGLEVALAAPGTLVPGTVCMSCAPLGGSGLYASGSGTSFSAPLVAGVAALVYQVDSSFTSDQVRQILQDSADDLGAGGYDIYFGWGRLNANRAVTTAQQRSVTFQLNSLSNFYAYPNPWDVRRHRGQPVRFANVPPGANIKIFTLSGFLVKSIDAPSGSADWNLTNSSGQPVASGVYFYLATSPTGVTSKGKLALIR